MTEKVPAWGMVGTRIVIPWWVGDSSLEHELKVVCNLGLKLGLEERQVEVDWGAVGFPTGGPEQRQWDWIC